MNNDDNIYNVIGKNIRKYRMKKGWTQRRLAETLLLSNSFIGKLESVTYQTLSIDTLDQIAKVLDTDIKNFFDRKVLNEVIVKETKKDD